MSAPGDKTFDRTTALGLVLMKMLEKLYAKGIIDPAEFKADLDRIEKTLRDGNQLEASYLTQVIRDFTPTSKAEKQ